VAAIEDGGGGDVARWKGVVNDGGGCGQRVEGCL
jgi:hypothetical protein